MKKRQGQKASWKVLSFLCEFVQNDNSNPICVDIICFPGLIPFTFRLSVPFQRLLSLETSPRPIELPKNVSLILLTLLASP